MVLTPERPRLVVTTTTPAIARAPYIEVAEPSFKIWKLSISSALSPATAEEISVVASPDDKSSAETSTASSKTTPSTTHNGVELPYIDVAPRTRIFGAVPNVPDTFWTETPAARPSRARLMSGIPSNFVLSASSLVVAPVKSRLSIFCTPVTTTSSITSESVSRTTLIDLPATAFTSCDL